MYARSISAFPFFHSLVPRVMHFRDSSRTNILREWTINEGYALGFPRIMELFATIRPGGESIDTSGPALKPLSSPPWLFVRSSLMLSCTKTLRHAAAR
ncbi:hypothetical protein HMPREF3056_11625 [Corynebacterium sp. HMSC056F09]|nr:hypothetical protein HMPREF3056_11625 [Corynebacterium sp. HMSC056F09]